MARLGEAMKQLVSYWEGTVLSTNVFACGVFRVKQE